MSPLSPARIPCLHGARLDGLLATPASQNACHPDADSSVRLHCFSAESERGRERERERETHTHTHAYMYTNIHLHTHPLARAPAHAHASAHRTAYGCVHTHICVNAVCIDAAMHTFHVIGCPPIYTKREPRGRKTRISECGTAKARHTSTWGKFRREQTGTKRFPKTGTQLNSLNHKGGEAKFEENMKKKTTEDDSLAAGTLTSKFKQ